MRKLEIARIGRRRQLLSLQAGRGIAALLVVIHHAALLTKAFSFEAGSLGVEFFFVLSGIVILMAHLNDIGDRHAFWTFAWKRFRRIYPIYWIVLLPQLLWIVYHPRQINLYQRDPWVIVSSILLVHLHSVHTTVTVAWTLFHEILFYGFFSLLLLSRRFGIIAMTAWVVASLFFLCHSAALPSPPWTNFFSPLHLNFALGMVAGWMILKGRIRWPIFMLCAGILIFSGAGYALDEHTASGFVVYLLAGLGATVAILGAVELEFLGHLRVYPSLVLLGDASYAIYLTHYPVVYLLAPAGLHVLPRGHSPQITFMVALTLLSVAFGICFHLLVELPLLRWMGGLKRSLPESS